MSNREIVLRLDERWYKALNRHLKNETLEEHMEEERILACLRALLDFFNAGWRQLCGTLN